MEFLANLLKGIASIAAGSNSTTFCTILIWDEDETPDELL